MNYQTIKKCPLLSNYHSIYYFFNQCLKSAENNFYKKNIKSKICPLGCRIFAHGNGKFTL